MSEDQVFDIEVFVPLLDEGTTVLRPAKAAHLRNDVFKLEEVSDYDPQNEHWQFPPGSTVRCARQASCGETILVAEELVCS